MNRPGNSRPVARKAASLLRVSLLATATAFCAFLFAPGPLRAAPAATQTRGRSAPATAHAPDKSYGVNTAPIRMDVFSDYQCPYCRAFYDQTLRSVIADYVSTGKVYLVHHDFPLVLHKYSGEAARWANACAEVGEFGPAEAALYDNQDEWGADGNIAKYISAAMPASDFRRVEAIMRGSAMPAPQATGSSVDPMASVAHPCSMDTYIAEDIKAGYQLSLPGTPDFVITFEGHAFAPVDSAVSWPVLKQLFDTLLKQ